MMSLMMIHGLKSTKDVVVFGCRFPKRVAPKTFPLDHCCIIQKVYIYIYICCIHIAQDDSTCEPNCGDADGLEELPTSSSSAVSPASEVSSSVSANSKLSRLISQLQGLTIPKDDGDSSSPEKSSESKGPSSPVVVDLTTTSTDDEIKGCDTHGPAEVRTSAKQRLAEFFRRRKAEKAAEGNHTKTDVPESSHPKAPISMVGGLETSKKNDYVLPDYVP